MMDMYVSPCRSHPPKSAHPLHEGVMWQVMSVFRRPLYSKIRYNISYIKTHHDVLHLDKNVIFLCYILQLGCPDAFTKTTRMPPGIYKELLELVRPLITRSDTNRRKAISCEERLSMTIRYLTRGW